MLDALRKAESYTVDTKAFQEAVTNVRGNYIDVRTEEH